MSETSNQGPRGPEGREGREGREGPVGREGPAGDVGQSDPELASEIQSLAGLVAENTQALLDSEDRQKETRRLAKRANINSLIAIAAAVLSFFLAGVSVYFYNEIREAQSQIEANAVTNCENANNSRAVQRNLWNGILDAPRDPGEPPPTETEEQFREAFREYINVAFGERDCSNLDKKYPEPEFPTPDGDE